MFVDPVIEPFEGGVSPSPIEEVIVESERTYQALELGSSVLSSIFTEIEVKVEQLIEPTIEPIVQPEIVNLPSLTAIEIRDKLASLTGSDRLDASAIKNLVGDSSSQSSETIILPSLPADTWVNFPTPTKPDRDWKIYLNNEEVSDDFLIREENEVMQIRSSVPYTNLKFVYE